MKKTEKFDHRNDWGNKMQRKSLPELGSAISWTGRRWRCYMQWWR